MIAESLIISILNLKHVLLVLIVKNLLLQAWLVGCLLSQILAKLSMEEKGIFLFNPATDYYIVWHKILMAQETMYQYKIIFLFITTEYPWPVDKS